MKLANALEKALNLYENEKQSKGKTLTDERKENILLIKQMCHDIDEYSLLNLRVQEYRKKIYNKRGLHYFFNPSRLLTLLKVVLEDNSKDKTIQELREMILSLEKSNKMQEVFYKKLIEEQNNKHDASIKKICKALYDCKAELSALKKSQAPIAHPAPMPSHHHTNIQATLLREMKKEIQRLHERLNERSAPAQMPVYRH